ncbi:MAG: 2OG-Fe(II) oxygenase [Blastocatellia bacterium]
MVAALQTIESEGWEVIPGHPAYTLLQGPPLMQSSLDQVQMLIAKKGRRIRQESGGPGTTEAEGGLNYTVLTGDVVHDELRWLWRLYTWSKLVNFVSTVARERMRVSCDRVSGATVNCIESEGARYEQHTDLAGWSAVYFLTTVPTNQGGELVLHVGAGGYARIFPRIGRMVIFKGSEIPHEVARLRTGATRLTAVFSFLPIASMADREPNREALNRYLFQTKPLQ